MGLINIAGSRYIIVLYSCNIPHYPSFTFDASLNYDILLIYGVAPHTIAALETNSDMAELDAHNETAVVERESAKLAPLNCNCLGRPCGCTCNH